MEEEKRLLRQQLSPWRELVVVADSVLGWGQDWHPLAMGAALTANFLFIWYWDPTLLTLLAVSGICVAVLDYLGPMVASQLKQREWTESNEEKFERACQDLENLLDYFRCQRAKLRTECQSRPLLAFLAKVILLLSLIWLGNRVNNFFLLYLVMLGALMMPGLYRRGLLQKYFAEATLGLNKFVKGKDHLKKAE